MTTDYRGLLLCLKCGKPIETRNPPMEVVAFEQKREQGGTNHIEYRRPTGRAIHRGCLEELKSGVSPDQGSLI